MTRGIYRGLRLGDPPPRPPVPVPLCGPRLGLHVVEASSLRPHGLAEPRGSRGHRVLGVAVLIVAVLAAAWWVVI